MFKSVNAVIPLSSAKSAEMDQLRTLDRVRTVLRSVHACAAANEIGPTTSIVDDLGFDSLRLVHLTLALEQEFEIDAFPMQAWYDAESLANAPRFTVASLVASCERCVESRRAEDAK
jgi:acyl carrier protein